MADITPSHTSLLPVPDKFIQILKEAVHQEIMRHQRLLEYVDKNNTPKIDKELFDIAYGNDIPILQAILDELNNPNQRIDMAFYKLCQNNDKTESTLLPIDRPTPQNEKVELIFGAKDWESARQIVNRYLGFE